MKQELANSLQQACQAAFQLSPEIQLELCKEPRHGDLSSNVAMQLSRPLGKNPREIAQGIIDHFKSPLVTSLEIAGPGFLNIRLTPQALFSIFSSPILPPTEHSLKGLKVNVEFVSANPTGPLTLGNGRLASIGDTLARCYLFLGADCQKEYYVNDYGKQVQTLTQSVLAKCRLLKGLPEDFPEDGYRGDYVIGLAQTYLASKPDFDPSQAGPEDLADIQAQAIEQMVTGQKAHLEKFGTVYDVWFREHTLHQGNPSEVDKVIETLKKNGSTEDRDGALWFLSTNFSDEKDRVLVRAGGAPTYFAADIAYHQNKFQRGYQRLINLWGADHHGYIERVKSSVAALGHDPKDLIIHISQMVQLKKEDSLVRMSKRKGNIVTLDHLMEEVPIEVCRWFFIMRSIDSTLDFDLELARDNSEKNPVYYAQYAHARICAILRKAGESAATEGPLNDALLTEEDRLLALKILELEVMVERAVARCAVHLVTLYAHELASAFHSYYSKQKILTQGPEQASRLMVIRRVKEAMAIVLDLAGVSAPEQM